MSRPSPLISLTEAATLLGVSRATVYRLVSDGHLPAYRLPRGRGTQVRESDVDQLIRRSADPSRPLRGAGLRRLSA